MRGTCSKEIEADMVYLFSVMDEKHKRHYASVEAIKLGHGGIKYISHLFGISEKTLERGIKELKKESASRSGQDGREADEKQS